MKTTVLSFSLAAVLAAGSLPAIAQNAAVVNGKAIPSTKLDKLIAGTGQPDNPELRKRGRDMLIDRELLVQEANQRGITQRDDVQEHRRPYGLIFLDPPTHSRSKRMSHDFDVQRDHVELLRLAVRLLAPGGTLVFSNNFQRFRLDAAALPELEVRDITRETVPPDFARNPRIHHCFLVTRRD